MESTQKDILFLIYSINKVETLFYNKMKFLNISHLIQILDSLPEEQLQGVKENMEDVVGELSKVKMVIDNLYIPSVELVKSYDRSNYVSENVLKE